MENCHWALQSDFHGHFSGFPHLLIPAARRRLLYTIRVGTVRYGPHSKEPLIRCSFAGLRPCGCVGDAISICPQMTSAGSVDESGMLGVESLRRLLP